MIVLKTVSEVRHAIRQYRRRAPDGGSVGFVPTMGYLHPGHTSLMDAARRETRYRAVSIFVNPTQFGPGEDYAVYPRDETRDLALCEAHGIHLVFLPEVREMYPDDPMVKVSVSRLTQNLCGQFRPGHFDGVTTVVSKLLNIVQPDRAYFGRKDAQQLLVIQRMVRELAFPVAIQPCDTVREDDGLAMSSRNIRLTPAGRTAAPLIYKGLQTAQNMLENGETDVSKLLHAARAVMTQDAAVTIQYLECRDRDHLEPMESLERPALIAVAAYIDGVRLIDNIFLEPPTPDGGIV